MLNFYCSIKKPLLPIATALLMVGCSTTTPNPTPQQPSPVPNKAECNCPPLPSPTEEKPNKPPALPLWEKSSFSQLPNWNQANHAAFLSAFAEQCTTLTKRQNTPSGLLEACKIANSPNAAAPQTLLENNFEVWQFQQEDGKKEGLLTGYYEPLLKGSRKKQGNYTVPLYAVPKDLVTVKLDELFPEFKGKRIRGRLQGNALVPYYDRAQWEQHFGPKQGEVLVWVNDKLDAFLLQVQGSGRVGLPDGNVIRLSYADQNGHPYRAIANTLIARGQLKPAESGIPAIRAWAAKKPNDVDDVLNSNPSVVFFQENKVLRPEQGPLGGLGLPLKDKLSLAVDRTFVPYGTMLWIDSTDPITKQPLQQGMLAQDTGGAIRGRVRGDFYWGTGAQAGQAAGTTKQTLKMWMLWPKGVPLPKNGTDSPQ